MQWLAQAPEPAAVLKVLPESSPEIGSETLARKGPTVECVYGFDLDDRDTVQHAIDISYEGEYELDEAGLSDGAELDNHFNALGGWIASMLVRLGDLDLRYKPTVQGLAAAVHASPGLEQILIHGGLALRQARRWTPRCRCDGTCLTATMRSGPVSPPRSDPARS